MARAMERTATMTKVVALMQGLEGAVQEAMTEGAGPQVMTVELEVAVLQVMSAAIIVATIVVAIMVAAIVTAIIAAIIAAIVVEVMIQLVATGGADPKYPPLLRIPS